MDYDIDALKERVKNAKYVFWSFSGGRDSTDALLATWDMFQYKQREIIYVDNGCEFPDLFCHIKRTVALLGAEVTSIKGDTNFIDYYTSKGVFPDSIHRDCIEVLINKPMDKYMRAKTNGDDYVLVRGGNSKQKTSRSGTKVYQWVKSKPQMIIYNPLYEIDRETLPKIDYWRGYDLGFNRTACWCCPFQRPSQYEAIREHYPMLYEELKIMFGTIAFKAHPGDGYLKYIKDYWVDKIGVDVQFKYSNKNRCK